jgi:hypothetical protein
MKKTGLIFAIILTIIGTQGTQSHASQFGVLAGFNDFDVATDPHTGNTSGTGFVGGLSFDTSLIPLISLEIDGLYSSKKYHSGVTQQTLNSIQFPAIFRLNLLPVISFGLGPYYQFGFDSDYSAAGLNTNDYGGVFSIRLKLPLPVVDILLDARYLLGLSNDNNASNLTSAKFEEFELLGGVTWTI